MFFLPLGLFPLLLTFVNGVIVDDTSDLLIYSNSPAWETASASQPATVIKWAGNSRGSTYGGTWHESLFYMSTMKFTFTGTSISCYGIVANVWDSTSIGFSIDGGTETRFTREVTDLSHQPSTAEDFDYGVQLFTTTGLSPTSHTLVLTGYMKSALFGFDYLEYTAVDAASTTGQITSSIQTTDATTSTATNSTSVSTPVSTPTNSLPMISLITASTSTAGYLPTTPSGEQSVSSTSQQGGQPNTAVLAGGVTGGVAILALLIFGVYWCLRRNRGTRPSGASSTITGSVQPFFAPDQTYTMPLTEKQLPAATVLIFPGSEHANRTVYQTYAKPPLPGGANSLSYETSGEHENSTASYYDTVRSPQGQLGPLTGPTAPPSFRTRPLTAQYQYGNGVDGPSSGSKGTLDIVLNDTAESFVRSPGEGDDSHTAGIEPMTSAPPYFEDVLARTDARNLSENDVDEIARRLAEVMRINNAARGGPGLLQGAPPRELIDQLVEDFLDERSDFSS